MRILCDVDNVVADFTGAICREASEILGRPVLRTEVKHWSFIDSFREMSGKQLSALFCRIRSKGFCAGLQPLPGAKRAVSQLYDIGPTYFVTSPWDTSPYWMSERSNWLIEQLGARHDQIIHAHAKQMVAGEVIIDDRPGNVMVGDRKLRVLIPNRANREWRNDQGRTRSASDNLLISKSWSEIIKAVKGVSL